MNYLTSVQKNQFCCQICLEDIHLKRDDFLQSNAEKILSSSEKEIERLVQEKLQLRPEFQKYELCLETKRPYTPRESLRKTSCSHLFHESCLQKWFDKQKELSLKEKRTTEANCPCCRKDLFLEAAFKGRELKKQEAGSILKQEDLPILVQSIVKNKKIFKEARLVNCYLYGNSREETMIKACLFEKKESVKELLDQLGQEERADTLKCFAAVCAGLGKVQNLELIFSYRVFSDDDMSLFTKICLQSLIEDRQTEDIAYLLDKSKNYLDASKGQDLLESTFCQSLKVGDFQTALCIKEHYEIKAAIVKHALQQAITNHEKSTVEFLVKNFEINAAFLQSVLFSTLREGKLDLGLIFLEKLQMKNFSFVQDLLERALLDAIKQKDRQKIAFITQNFVIERQNFLAQALHVATENGLEKEAIILSDMIGIDLSEIAKRDLSNTFCKTLKKNMTDLVIKLIHIHRELLAQFYPAAIEAASAAGSHECKMILLQTASRDALKHLLKATKSKELQELIKAQLSQRFLEEPSKRSRG